MRRVVAIGMLATVSQSAYISPTTRIGSSTPQACAEAGLAAAMRRKSVLSTGLDVSGRREILGVAGAALVVSSVLGTPLAAQADSKFVLAPPERGGLQAKWLEKVRVLLQDEADAIQYGGELAPGGPPSPIPTLLLIPIVQMQATLRKASPLVNEPVKWPTLLAVVESGPFENLQFKKIFNGYSDNIYYSSDSPEANAYLLGGATPSSRQTNQYLLRNEALKQLGELRDEIRYQQTLKPDQREPDQQVYLKEIMAALLKCFDDYLALAPKDELKTAREAVYGEGRS